MDEGKNRRSSEEGTDYNAESGADKWLPIKNIIVLLIAKEKGK